LAFSSKTTKSGPISADIKICALVPQVVDKSEGESAKAPSNAS
jgi:hypothetical protein